MAARARCLLKVMGAVLVGLVLIAPAWTHAAAGGMVTLRQAEAEFRPDHAPVESRHVLLAQRWDRAFPGRNGTATYRIELPPTPSSEPQALFMAHVGNQLSLSVNGVLLLRLGEPGDAYFDAGRTGVRVPLPAGLLHADRANQLVVEITAQPLRGAGLSPVQFGPDSEVVGLQARHRLLDDQAPTLYAASLLLMGGLAGALWWRQRDRLFGCFALMALFGAFRQFDRSVAMQPLPWPLWGWVLAISYGLQLGLIGRFILLALEHDPPWLRRATYATIASVLALATLSFSLAMPLAWTIALTLLEFLGVVIFSIVLQKAIVARRPMAWLLTAAGTGLLITGAFDLVFVRIGASSANFTPLTPHALFLFVLILAGIIAMRFSRSVAEVRSLNRSLADRVAEREQQLRLAFEDIRVQREEQAVAEERQRLMREIHDGIGSQLIGLLSLAEGRRDDPQLEEQVRGALDEMRIAVDSLQPVGGDLTTVLATLRYRLQPRLQAAQIAVEWHVDVPMDLPPLTPHQALNLQRILLEAVTNVLKHARASQLRVNAHWRDGASPGLQLRLADDGIGPGGGSPPAGSSRGLGNMATRASALGATLSVQAAASGGTEVLLEWPLEAMRASALRA